MGILLVYIHIIFKGVRGSQQLIQISSSKFPFGWSSKKGSRSIFLFIPYYILCITPSYILLISFIYHTFILISHIFLPLFYLHCRDLERTGRRVDERRGEKRLSGTGYWAEGRHWRHGQKQRAEEQGGQRGEKPQAVRVADSWSSGSASSDGRSRRRS